MLESEEILPSGVLHLDAATLPPNEDPWTHLPRFDGHGCVSTAADAPEAELVPEHGTVSAGDRPVQAREIGPVFCSRSFTSVHVPEGQEAVLEEPCLTYNSRLPVYYLLLTSGRLRDVPA